MAKIVPFRGFRYNLERIDNPAAVMSPPYDEINSKQQADLYGRDPFNVVRLILGDIKDDDSETDNRYTRAAATFRQWQEQGVLVQDEVPSIYLYDQEFLNEAGAREVRSGYAALCRLEDFSSGVIKPHEKTLAVPRADRLALTKACNAHFSPIFSLYADPCCVLEALTRKEKANAPLLEITDDEGVIHRLWQVSDPSIIKKAHDLLENKPVFLADGHHRYETALLYRNFMREKHPEFTGKEVFNYVLMYFSNMEDHGQLIFPTHRLLFNLDNFDFQAFLKTLEGFFEVEAHPVDPDSRSSREGVRHLLRQKGEEKHTLALYGGDEQVYFLTLHDVKVMDRFFDPKSPKALRTLDVSILHKLILENILQISPEAQEQQTNLKYVRNIDDPFKRVRSGEFQLAVLMNPSTMSEVRDVANAGEKMPQKSTYFYPKLLTGLVINKIVEDERVEG